MDVDGYIRVSRRLGRSGPGYISPDVQREAIQRWADYKGVTVAAWHVDEDESGGNHDRPGLLAAVERATNGGTGGIVAWKIDRFSRYTEGGLRDLRRLERVGARLAFVTEDIDTSGPMGKFVYTIMLAMGEYFLDTIKAGWITTKTRAMARGVKIGPTPYGYLRTKSQPLTPHPEHAPIVAEAFTLAARDGLAAASAYLHANAPERVWALHRVRRFLRNRAYLGESRYGELVQIDAHPPLVTRAAWEAAQPGEGKTRGPSAGYPLSGIAACESCGGPMVGAQAGAGIRTYRCSAASNKKGTCDAPATMTADRLEGFVYPLVEDALSGEPGFEAGVTDPEALAAAEAAMMETEQDLVAFASDTKARSLLGDRYHPIMEERANAREGALAAYRALLAQSERRHIPTVEAAKEDWPGTLRAVLSSVVVTRGRGGDVGSRVAVRFHGSDDLARESAA